MAHDPRGRVSAKGLSWFAKVPARQSPIAGHYPAPGLVGVSALCPSTQEDVQLMVQPGKCGLADRAPVVVRPPPDPRVQAVDQLLLRCSLHLTNYPFQQAVRLCSGWFSGNREAGRTGG